MPTSQTGNRAARTAFTLIELVVVISITAALAGMTVPRLLSAGNGRVREDARRLLAAARFARDYAATRHTASRLMLDCEQGRFSVTCQGISRQDNQFAPVPGQMGRPLTLGPGVRFGRLNITPRPCESEIEEVFAPQRPGCVTFTPHGQADAAVLALTDGRRSFSLLISPGGQARLVSGIVNDLPNDRIDLDN